MGNQHGSLAAMPLLATLLLIVAFAGLTASFVCVVLERGLEGRKPDGRSMCVCGALIPMYRNIPVLSWPLQRGRAACCGAKIPVWYFAAEVGAALCASTGAVALRQSPWAGGVIGTVVAILVLWRWHVSRFGARGGARSRAGG